MKKFAFFAVAAALVMAGCGKDDDPKADDSLDLKISIYNDIDLSVGDNYQLTSTVVADPTNLKYNVVWESSAPEVVSVDVATGLIIVAKNDTINESYSGKVEITATATAVNYPNISASDTCTVYVNFHEHDDNFYYLGDSYKTVTLKDGNKWMAENLRYVPAGKVASTDYTADAGVWFPAGADNVADQELLGKKGYLYDCATAFGVAAINEENAMSFEGTRGICPKGWHIPTNAELTGLVGQNSNSALIDTTAPYYDVDTKGAPIDALNADGFNWTFVGIRNKTSLTGAGSYVCNVYEDAVGAMSYVLGSTCYQIKKDAATGNVTNYQYYSLMSTYNKSFKRLTVAYGNVMAGMSVRCIKDKE